MKRSTSRWIVGAGGGAILHVGLFWMVGVVGDPEESDRVSQVNGASIRFVGSNSEEMSPLMKEQIALFDPKPLMKPTRWNGANFERLELKDDAGEGLFVDYAPMFASDTGDFIESYGNQWAVAPEPKKTQLGFPISVSKQFGRGERSVDPQLEESLGLETIRLDTGETIARQSVYNNAALEISKRELGWDSVEFVVEVMDSFAAGAATVARSSGFPEIDREFSELLRRELLPKGLLSNGSYLVRISR